MILRKRKRWYGRLVRASVARAWCGGLANALVGASYVRALRAGTMASDRAARAHVGYYSSSMALRRAFNVQHLRYTQGPGPFFNMDQQFTCFE